jgi:putative membrane protein
MVLLLCIAIALTLTNAIYPKEQWLQHAGTPIIVPLLLVAAKRNYLSNVAFTCLVLFYLLHVVGARYLYSTVPGGESLHWLALGKNEPGRNHYDRLVHLAFGALLMPVLVEFWRERLGLGCAPLAAMGIVLLISGLYEIFEWGLTVMIDPADAERYNGQQGDMWDAQKDMFLAWVGSILALPLVRERSASPRAGT